MSRALQFAGTIILVAVSSPSAASSSSLGAAIASFDRAQVSGDRRLLQSLLANDYRLVNSGGSVETKRDFIADLTDPAYHLNPYQVLQAFDRRWANGAVLGGVVRLTGSASGQAFDLCLRFADVWRFQHHRWQVVYTQAARAPAEQCGHQR